MTESRFIAPFDVSGFRTPHRSVCPVLREHCRAHPLCKPHCDFFHKGFLIDFSGPWVTLRACSLGTPDCSNLTHVQEPGRPGPRNGYFSKTNRLTKPQLQCKELNRARTYGGTVRPGFRLEYGRLVAPFSSASGHPSFRFALNYTTEELLTDAAKASQFKDEFLHHESRFFETFITQIRA